MLRWLFKKQILDTTRNCAEDARAALRMAVPILLKEEFDGLQIYGDAMATIINETSQKFGISKEEAVYADSLKWRQLSISVEDFKVASLHGMNLRHGIFSTTHNFGQTMGMGCTLMMINYELKFRQQQFPDVLSGEVSELYRFGTSLVNELYRLGKHDIDPDEFSDWLTDREDDIA